MREKDLIHLLEEARPPEAWMAAGKAALRERLLEAHSTTAGRASRRRLSRYAVAAALAASVLLAMISFRVEPVSAASILHGAEQVYDTAGKTGAIHYVRQILSWDDEPPVEIEQWSDISRDRFRSLHRDRNTGRLLGHTITLGDRFYSSGKGRITSRRMMRRQVEADDAPAPPAVPVVTKILMAVRPDPSGATSEGDQEVMQAILVREIDRGQFTRLTPEEILDGFLEDPDVDYLGVEIQEETGREHHLLRTNPSSGSPSLVLEFPRTSLNQVLQLLSRINTGEIRLDERDPRELLAEAGLQESGASLRESRVVKTIRIDVESLRITETDLSVTWDATGIYRLRKNFLDDAWLEGDPDLFDPDLYGLAESPEEPALKTSGPTQGR